MSQKINRWAELYCVLFGHEFGERRQERDGEFVLVEELTCTNCHISTVDRSGQLQKAYEQYGIGHNLKRVG